MTTAQTQTLVLWCCGCNKEVEARLADGRQIYPHRPDLFVRSFWRCDTCGNYVGGHWKSNTPLRPLGSIPTPALRLLRAGLHMKFDTLWKFRGVHRGELYRRVSEKFGRQYHAGEIRSAEEAKQVSAIIDQIIIEQDWT